jgi:hypothetical protein
VFALALVAAVVAGAPPAPADLHAAYSRMLEARYATAGVPVPAGGIEFAIDSARFRLATGELRALEPVAGGRVCGLVFRGDGALALDLPDARELGQFRRAAERPGAARLETSFTSLVLRDGGGLVERVLGALPAGAVRGPYAPDRLALDRREVWLERRLVDADAWAARALAGDGGEWALAEVESPDLGWLAVEFDPFRAEELQVARWRPDELATELWISLDRERERGSDGRPASALVRQFDLRHAAIAVDLREASKKHGGSGSDVHARRARFEATLAFQPRLPELRTLAFDLDPWVELDAVRDDGGGELLFLRDHVGARSTALDDQLYDNSALVLLPEPVGAEERRFTFLYEGEVRNYVGGRDWYPGEEEAYADLHTAELALTALPKHDLRAMGREVERRDDEESRFRRFAVERPVRTVTFAFAERFEEQRIELPGAPAVVAFATHGRMRDKAYNVAADVVNAWRFYADRFGPGPDTPELLAASILARHGQAFEGFLHLGSPSWEVESRGPTELFRAHEVAHEWWGHLVGWASYRDQWLSEGFATYAAMRFVEAAVEDGPRLYREIVESFATAAMGEAEVSRFQNFQRPINPRQWRRVGPIALGYRASTAEVRHGYYLQAYYRGALVLHMLRRLLGAKSGSDDLFDAVLADFAREFRGREASTADFAAALARRAPGDWSWFFRQWVDETAIPTWRWSWRHGKSPDGGDAVIVEVEQAEVGPGFRMPVPVRIESGAGASRTAMVLIDEPRETFTLPLERPAKKVVLNPDLAVLAKTERR